MLDDNNAQTAVVRALKERIAELDDERSVLAARVHDLEAEVQAAREGAERRASEAIHLEALIAFYENGSQTQAPAVGLPASALLERNGPSDADEIATLPARRASPQWTLAWRDEAIAVLRGQGEPMHYRELYRAISARGFTFGGKSPEATFLASLSRDQATFVGVGRGCYWIAGEAIKPDAVVAGPRRRARKPRPIGSGR